MSSPMVSIYFETCSVRDKEEPVSMKLLRKVFFELTNTTHSDVEWLGLVAIPVFCVLCAVWETHYGRYGTVASVSRQQLAKTRGIQ